MPAAGPSTPDRADRSRAGRVGLAYYGTCRIYQDMSRQPGSDSPALPSHAELKILRDLWVNGESTVRDIHARVAKTWPVGYTTVLKLLQRMLGKGLVGRRGAGRAHTYRAAVSETGTRRRLARGLVERAFGGSIRDLVEAALPPGRARSKELDEIRRLLQGLRE